MNRTTRRSSGWAARWAMLAAAGLLSAGVGWAQVPVDEDGNPLQAEAVGEAGDSQAAPADTLLSDEELQALVGPIALYPDDLLAVVLPASAYPLQIVQAARFLENLEVDEDLEPDPEWNEAVVALLNYPEVIEMMNEDLEWTYALGEAVVRQQPDVVAAIETFRDRAYAAGNLKSDDHQTVTRDDGVIQIEPVEEEIIYVPYYEPERVVVYQPTPVYHYYSRPYPVYYYPYPYDYSFFSGHFWGVTTAFRIGWLTDHLHVFHHSYFGHPYYGHHYYGHWYRRPTILVYNRYYVNDRGHRPPHHERDGDFWRPRRHSGALIDRYRDREAYYTDRRRERSEEGYRDARDARQVNAGRDRARSGFRGDGNAAVRGDAEPGFARPRSDEAAQHGRNRPVAERRQRQAADDAIRFRPRDGADEAAIRLRPEVARREAGEDRAIRFRPRPERTERAAPSRAGRDAPERVSRTDRRIRIERPSVDRSVRPSIREHSTRPRASASPPRRAAPAPRAVQRAPAPRPRISTPRSITPRAAPAPRASRPSAPSHRAPSRPSHAAPRRENRN